MIATRAATIGFRDFKIGQPRRRRPPRPTKIIRNVPLADRPGPPARCGSADRRAASCAFFSRSARLSAICFFLRGAVGDRVARALRSVFASACAALVAGVVAAEEHEREAADARAPSKPANTSAMIHGRSPSRQNDLDVLDLRRVERGGEPLLLAVVARAIPEARTADAGRAMPALQLALRVLADEFVDEQILGDDRRRLPCPSPR